MRRVKRLDEGVRLRIESEDDRGSYPRSAALVALLGCSHTEETPPRARGRMVVQRARRGSPCGFS